MQKSIAEIDDLLSHGRISFQYLWALYKPGDLVALWRPIDSNPNFWLAHAQKFQLFKKGDGMVWSIEVLSTAITGNKVGSQRNIFEFPDFVGTIEITELPVVPLRYHPDRERIKDEALTRANMYQTLMKPFAEKAITGERGVPAHRHYTGPVWIPEKALSRNREDGHSRTTARRKKQAGYEFFDSAAFNVSVFSTLHLTTAYLKINTDLNCYDS